MNNLSNILQSSNHTEGITFITPKEEFLSYGELYSNSLKLLGFFNDKGLKKNSKLIFQLSSNKNFVNSFWACIVGGVVAVPVSTGNNDEHRLKLFNIYALLDDAYLIIDSDILDRLESFAQKNSLMDIFLEIKSKTIDIRDINLETLSLAKAVESDKDDLALIQFSSGSTGEPKGVMISGDKIIQNAKGFLETAKIDREDSYLSWFPLTHDMGLMGWHINPLILGVNQVLIETNVFIRRPLIWLESATKYKSSILCSPNFGYRYLLQFLKKEQNWDLSHIRLIFNGAEPISSTLCDEFLERLEPYGLKSEAMYPVYGLAEATLAVAFPKPNEMFRRYILDINHLTIGERVKDLKTDMGSVTYVDVGYPLTNMQIRITDDRVLDENFIGHIEIKSISVTDGYYNNPKATSEVIKDDGWLDTGDLGFMRDGRLIITGRAKDIIIKNGANYYPHDIEDICCEINGCELNKVVAIGRRDTNQEDEEIIVFVLFKKDLKEFLEIESEIKKVVLNKIGLEVSKVIPVKTIYKTTSGKLQRYKFLQKYSSGEYDETIKELANFSNDFTISKDDILSTLKVEAEEILDSSIEMDKPLFEQGFSSISLVSYKNKIAKKLNIEIDITTIFDYPTLNALANYLCSNPSITDEQSEKIDNNIAIVSSACIFPDASNPEEFFDNLLQGVDSIQKSSRWTKEYYGGFLSDDVLDRFDNEFFNISPAEANSLDPQVKILLQTSLDLLERGAVDYQKEKNIGLFIGVSSNDNLRLSLGKELTPYTLTSNLNSTLSGRVSYFFDFNAPAISIDTACSSSLVAISQAINAIKSGDCKMAIAGGVNVILDAQTFEGLSQIHALSPTNRCKTFDESGDGYVRGEGCGLILLKPLQSAIDDRDEILGVIKSATINHDGKSNGLTAPNGLSQQNLLKKAYSGIDRVDFIETHGTGTKLGDPIELNALSSVFKNQKIMLGAVKTNIGHLESSAGVAGVIKTLMAIKYKKLPANLHLKDKNSFIDWDKIKLSPLTKNLDWISDKPKVAGISSFGFSGTNAHIVLEEFIDKPQRVDKEYKILLVSAKDNQSVDKLSHLYIENLTKDNLENFIFSTSKKYKYNEKIAIVGADLEDFKSSKNIFKSSDREDLKTIFVFTGQGSQYPNMAKELFDNEPIFRKYFIECDNIFKKYLPKSLVDVVYKEAEEVLNEPIYTQSSLFAVEYAIAKYLIDLNIIPDGVTGHSLGEYVGAVISGVLSLEDAIKLVLVRSKLISSLDIKGSMYLFMTTEDIVFNAINSHYDKLSIASVNALNRVVVSGEDKALIEVVNELEAKGIKSIKLNINHPYHSVLLDTLLFDFYYEASKITYDKPNIAFISAMRATQVETIDANYFVTHFRNSVRFADTISYLNAQNFNTFIEIGADAHLSPLIIGQSQNVKVISTLRRNRPLAFYEGLANLYINHFDINWDKFYMDYGDKIPTPTHPMRESRFEINYANQMVQSLPNITKPKKTTINSMEKLKESIYQVSGIKDIDEDKNLFELGLDSLSLFGLRENIKKEFSIEIDMKDFYQTLNTLTLISKYIDSNSRVEEEEVSVEYTPQTTICQSSISDNQLIKEQLDSINNLTNLFSKQLDKLGKSSSSRVEDEEIDDELIKNASLKMLKTTIDDLSLQQQEFIDKFILEYNQKHQKSKEFMIKNKNQVADWINTVIYRQTLKEINFPIVAKEAIGANFVDMDKNRYIDISMGYGSVFLGHNHPKVQKAMEKIIKKGFVLAPQTELIEEVASIIREFTNTQRVVFSNTGTEAVMAVVRAVRAVSKKRKVIKFQGSFHGTSDVILNTGDENSSYPTSIGINPSVADGMLEFQYGSPKIFEFIRENHQDIAGVLVEPIQSRRPDFQPREFLKQLREVTNEFDIALIFDEMITGFRCARGGVSEIFDIKPNISTFGKVVGGTMAIGIIAGDAKYLDAFDGGEWEFGDESFPQADMITFGGTFCKHPLTLSASLATLKVLKKNPNIQQEVNSKTDYLAKELNEFFTQNSFPIKLNNFGSLFRFDFFGEYSPTLNPIEIDMFFYMLIQKGVYTWEKRVCFLSASHTQSDLDFIIKCVRETLTKMRENGFFDKIKSDNLLTKNSNTIEATTIEATSLQKRLYILSQFENSSSIYNMYMGWQTTHLDIEKAQRVFREIIASNPSLRTNLFIKGDRVYQKISNYDFEIEVLEINSDIDDRILDFVNRDFDLSSEILFKVLVIKRRDDFIMVIKTHHTIFDGPSIDIVMDSFHKLYRGETITNPTKDYFDFTTIYNDFLKSPKMKKQEEFWLDSFSDTPPKLNLPIDKPYPKNRTFKSDIEYFEIDNRVTQKLKQSAKRYNVSINILLFSSFSILLNRLSSQNDIVIGVPVTLRDMEFSSVVGMFANSVAIRNKIDFDLNILEYFQTNQKIFLEMLDNIEYPFEELVERLNLKKDLARNALFDVMFIYEDGSKRLFDKFGFQKYEIKKLSSDFDLTLEVIDEGDTLFCSYEYYSEIFNPSTIKRFISYFIKILDEIQENKPLKDIDIISNDEKEIVKSFNQTDKKYPKNKTIIELFENQVKKNPKEIAILYKNSTLSYDELNQKANSLGYYLREKFSIKADTIVAILMDRSEFMVISILAILKAGGAYLPIDPEYPKDRVEYMLSDSKTKLLICDRDISYGDDLEILNIQELSLDNNIDNLKSINSSDDLAYLIYTSGSTGQPKGVMITHQNVVGFSQNMEDNFGIKQRDSIYAITTISFDISVLELISSLLFNLKVIISSNNSIEDNLQEIKDNKIDIIQTTPSRFKAFLDLDRSSLLGVERLLVGGEALSPSLLDRLRELGCEIYNVYGPTEATVWSSFKRVDNASLDIGKPLFNESAYILDTNQNQLPIGAIGELHIGGDGLSRGYFNQDELTKEKFITHPILGRIYKTGDMARYKSSGDIEYLGRIDDQVKIRGYRIELGEIESAILGYTNIKESVVIANNQELVAYIVGEQKELKSYLASILPNYMIPSYFVQIDSLPLTPNGKVDKKRLPKYQNIEEIKSYIAPTTKTQIELSKIFSEVLKQDNISIDDNFLNIGGHSLSAITLVSKINQKLNSNLKIKDIFAKGSIKELADILDKSSDEFIYRDFVISHSSKENNLFNITNVQQAYLFGREGNFEMGNTSTHIYSEAIFSTLDIQRLQESLNILLQRHDALRLIFDNGKQRVSEHKPYTIRDNGVVDSDGLTQIRDRLSHKIYDISSAPLLDVEISQYEGEYIFHISIDALIMDGVSSIDFIFEWGNLYNNINYPLKPLDISFEDYMLSYTKVRESELFDRAKNYWLDKIYDYNLEYNLPYKQTPSLVKEPKFSRYTNKIDSSIWRELKTKAKEQKLGLTSIVLSVYAEVLCYFSNQHNFTLNLTLFNRLPLHSQIDDILGDFTVLELFNYKKENKSIREILKSSHDSLWEDLEHILYDGIDFQRDIRREFHIDTNKIVAPIVLTSILRGDDADSHFELNFDGYIKQGYAITQTPQVYLDNKAYEDSEGNFIAEWDFVEQIFSHDTIEAMHTLYCNLIEQVATSDWSMPLKALSLPKKDKNLIEEINTTEDKNLLKSLKPLHTLFEEQALKTPQNIAVIDEDGEYSYRDINNYANSIAIILDKIKTKSKGVAIYSQKGYTQVVSTLGVMKSGKFYLPLGKSPLARIRDILTEAKVDTLLVSQDYYKQIKELSSDYNILIIEESISIEYKEKELLSLPKVELDDIAYVIYTSGSTGKPKGVIATHKGASNTILAINEKFGIDSSDRAFGISELSFDLSVYDIFGMLSAGGAVVFPQSKRREEPLYWCELINRHSVTIYNSVPQLANLLYESAIDNSIKLNSLRAVLMSGDYIPITLPNIIKNHNDNAIRVMSLGGATEGTIWSIWYEIEDIDKSWQSIPYGVAMPNQGIYILNSDLTPCPIGVKGDLYITGTSVSLGYYEDEKRTNQAFISHPTLGYIYKTGDLGVLNERGYYEFRGRDDNQVKVRGFRVELGEIESSINSFEGIKESATLIVEDSNNQKAIASFIVPIKQETKEEIEQEDIDIEGFLNDPIERLEFKLSQNGNRVFEDNQTIKLSNKKDTILLAKAKEIKKLSKLSSNILVEDLSILLNSFSNTPVENNPLPKYYYPSAGSLYPIQIYLYIPKDTIDDIKEGYYYYDRANHQLVLISEEYNALDFIEFYFVSKPQAMQPMYGPATRGFCLMEIGHIYQLFLSSASSLSLGVKSIDKIKDIYDTLGINSDYSIDRVCQIGAKKVKDKINSFELSLFERQSFRLFKGSIITQKAFSSFLQNSIREFDLSKSGLKIYIYIKNILTYQEGYYFYDGENLEFVSKGTLPSSLYQGRNKTIYDGATFAIFLITTQTSELEDKKAMSLDNIDKQTLIDSGFYGQLLMNYSVKEDIGLCPIGFIDTDPIRDSLQIKSDESVIYSFLGGAIDKNQTTYWGADDDQHQNTNLIDELKTHLKNSLLAYMIPTYFVSIEKLPLTPNGKIDKRALYALKDSFAQNTNYIAPSTPTQKELSNLFSEILKQDKISIESNFFELGGHSLLAIALISKVNQKLNSNIQIADIFKYNSIRELSSLIESSSREFIYKDFVISSSKESEGEVFGLTNVQQAYLFGREDSFEMGNISTHGYNESIFSSLDIDRLEESFNILIQRHAVLRLIFIDGKQKITPYRHYTIKDNGVVDSLSLKAIRDRLSHKVYEPSKAYLFDIEVSRYQDEYILHLSIDVLLMDGVSMSMFIDEWIALYNDISTPLKPLDINFADYISSYTKVRESELLESAREYWIDKIYDYNLEYNLPYQIEPSSVKKPNFSRCTKKIDSTIWREFKNKTKAQEIGVTSAILALYSEALCYFSNQTNFTLNLTLFNRLPLHEQINDILGDFTVLELFNYKKENKSIKDILQDTHNQLWQDLEHILYDGIDFQRDIRREFNINSTKIVAPIVLTSILRGEETNFDINFDGYLKEGYAITQTPQVYIDNKAYEDSEGNFIAEWDFVEQIFSHDTIEAMHTLYCNLIEQVATSDWDMPLKALSLPKKDKNLIEEINTTEDKELLKSLKPLNMLFEEQALKTPQNIAVIDEDGEYSYRDINNYANSIAIILDKIDTKSKGVAIYSQKGYNQVVSTLGVMKSGKFYLPLGKSPLARIRDILTEAKVDTLLVSQEYYKQIKELSSDYNILIIEENISIEYKEKELLSLPKVELDDIAYVIYTSGSTGKPKGVIATHKGASNTILAINEKFGIDSSDRAFGISELSFDLSVYDIFGMLSAGGAVVFPQSKRREEPLYWCELINRHSVTIYNSVPQLANLLYESAIDNSIKLNSLRAVLMSGDYIPITLPNIIKEHNDNAIRVMSLGGATEGTIWSIWYEIEDVDKSWQSIPYGVAMPNQGIYILNSDLTPCPIGVKGDLYITGTSVSLGYYEDKKRTNQAFISHPTLGYIYKTGDLGVLNERGYYEFRGRDDNQVKVRGFRVELGEIESIINQYPKIKNAIVILHNRQLIAYIVSEELIENELESYLKEKLPTYMIPTYFINMESMPLTPNGKIDKKALPNPQDIETHKESIAPTTPNQKELWAIFSEVLKQDNISIDDNFFELGGDSLSAISIITKISKDLNIKIELGELFSHPTIEALSSLLDSKNKIEYSDITPLPISSSYALSSSQTRLWALDKIESNLYAYNESFAIEFEGMIDLDILKHSLDILVNRHEILRTNFIEVDVEPRQIIREKLSESIYQKVEVENVEKYMQDETKRVFDLERDTLFYIRVINTNILFLNIHHIICDVWSIDIMVDELSTIYNALSNNKEITLPPLTIGYKDYSHWQNTLLEDDNYIKANRTYWHNLLDGHKVLEFPTDFKRASTQSFEGDSFRYIFDSKITKKIKELSSDNTLFITLLTLINILLSKYSNEEDILIGSPISNRVHQNLLNQIGFYLNTLPLRNILNPNSSFKETLESIKKSTLESFSHQTYPFDKLVDELNLERNLNQNPLFNIMLVVHSSNQSEIKFGDIKAKSKEIERKISKFDITLNFSEIDDNLAIDIEYNTSLFTSETIENLALNLETLIDNLTPNSAISEIDIVSPNQKEILKGFNNTEVDYPKDKTLIELFEAQVLKTPNNIALVYEQREITYQELNHRANVVGLYLRENFDIKPDTIVPLLLDRGEWMIVAILGVLKSGGAYLPIDIEYPKSRIEYILSDSQSQLLICDKSTIDENIDIQKIDIESLDFGRVVSNLESINSSTNLAYLIYTSGSTGEPKGVMVEHKGIVNAILAQIEFYEMSEEIRLFQFTTYSFDVSVSEIFTTLLCGATLITSSKESMIDNFASVIEDNKVNMLNVTPSFLKSIPKLKGIKTLITAGESAIAKDALEYAKDTTYINGYGPTETFYVSLYRVDSQKSYSSIPIGRQMSNIKIYILDKNAKLLPIGAVGELCVAGDALARGYLNRPKLTDEKFINHPQFGRMYKTGDIAKYQSDGNIEYLGRVDEQIKIRGFRVELGEIETLIGSYKDIKESVVIAKDEHLIAYIVGEIDIDALKSYLKERLPNYMIPSYFVQINALPLTTNGKIDKKSLPMVDIDLTKSYNAPQNLLQSQLCKIFEDVLDIERVGIDDNFFEIGGHSIKAIKIISKIGELNYSVSIKDIFLAPSIRELSSIIDKDKINLQNISIPQREDTLYHDISYGQKGLFLLSLMNQDMSAYNIPIALLLEGELDIQALREALKALIIKHEVLRTQFMLVDGTPKLRVLNDIEIDLDQRDIDESELQKEVDLSINHLFDIEKGSLFNIKILKISPKKNALVIVMHHILVDGWSMEIISKDIQNFYNSYLENRTIEIDKPLVEYIDFVEYQKEMLPYIDNQREYLLDNFIGFKNQLELPIDFDKSLKRTFEGDFISINLGKENSKILRDIAQKENKSLFALLVSVIDVLLYLYSKEEDIVIATPTNNIRQDKRFSNLVGYCLNTLAIKSKIDGDKSFLENFNSISMDIYSGFDNSDYPFDKLIEDLKLSSQIDKNPLFSVMVILQNFQESKLEFNGLDITPLNVAGAGSKFDLKFEFLDEEDIFVMIEYSLDLFKKETIEKMMSNLVRLFELISKDIDATLLYLEKSLDLDSSLIDLIDITQEIDEDF